MMPYKVNYFVGIKLHSIATNAINMLDCMSQFRKYYQDNTVLRIVNLDTGKVEYGEPIKEDPLVRFIPNKSYEYALIKQETTIETTT